MPIPYIKAERNQNTVNCNTDLVVLHNRIPIMISAIDISLVVKKLFSDMILSKGKITLYDRENIFYEEDISVFNESFRYKLTKHDNKNTHGIIYNTNQNNYLFDWNNDGMIKSLTNFLSTKHFLPVSEEVVEKAIELQGEHSQFITDCTVLTSQDELENLKVWHVHVTMFKELLEQVEFKDDGFKWDEIEDTTDYLVKFVDPIMKKIHENVEILYDENKVHPKINDSEIKPYDGQIPLIQGGLEVLKRKENRFLYLAANPGVGKTMIGSKINHLHHDTKNKDNYVTLIIAPSITLTQWKDELRKSISEDIDIITIRKTDEFINFYNKTNLQPNKPTYLLVGKETFKLSYQVKHGVIPKRKTMKVKQINEKWGWEEEVEKTIGVCECPDCGLPIKNELRKTEDVYFTEFDFSKPKKSNYKCNNCGSVLFQAMYNKTRKTSIMDFVKRKNIKFDSIIVDEAHEGNGDSIIGIAQRNIIRRAKKVILLSGTVTNGYSSSIYNVLFSLMPNQLKKDNAFTKDEFVKMYGTLVGKSLVKDSDMYSTNRLQVRDSQMQEVEGINPLVVQRYMLGGFLSADLEDVNSNLPDLEEHYVKIKHDSEVLKAEHELIEDFKKENALNTAFYEGTIVKHYTNNPFSWNKIPILYKDGSEKMDGYVQPKNLSERVLPKEEKLVEICLEEKKNNRKTWVYLDNTSNGQYAFGENLQARLKRILEQNGLRVFVLQASTKPIDRKALIDKNSDKYDVFLSNPKLISVGINLQFCTNYIFYSPSYHVNTVRQASLRGRRADSTEHNKIYHLYNSGLESSIMERFKLKRVESESVENKFSQIEDVKRTASGLSSKINKELSEIL